MTGPGPYRVPEAADLLGVSSDTVRRWLGTGKLSGGRDAAGRLVIDGRALADLAARLGKGHFAEVGATSAHSARNRFPGIVTKVTKDDVMAQVELQAGPFRVVSLMSREAADELGLAPGVAAVASVKATNVTVELPAGASAAP
jgi:molybdopterin-binding protein